MGLLDNYTGIGMSPRPRREHQEIIGDLIYRLKDDREICLPEFCIDAEDLDSQVPDVVIYESADDRYPHIIIEVTTTRECKKIIEKVKQLMIDYPALLEAFVYDYEREQWYCFGSKLDTRYPSYSEILESDFNNYL